MCGSSRNSVEQLPPATTELVVFGTLSFGQVEGQESICCPSPAQSFPLLGRERRENFLGLYFMVVGIKSFCLSFPSGQQGWQLKHKVHRCGSGLCPGTCLCLSPPHPWAGFFSRRAYDQADVWLWLWLEAVWAITCQDSGFQNESHW